MAKQNRGGSLVAWSLIGTIAGWLAYSALGIDRNVKLPRAISAEQKRFSGRGTGFLSYYVDKSASGRPLVLIHSINAAATAYELRPLFECYRGSRPVYALDLPGFGFSERANRAYTPELYVQAILDLLEKQVGEAADVIALSLGGEFAAKAALARPDLIHSLTLISPTGFSERGSERASQRASHSNASDSAYQLLSFPLWAQGLYDLITTRGSIHYFLQLNFENQIDIGLEEYAYLTTHQRGARHAPLYFVSGKLFTQNIRTDAYERLTLPVLVIYDRDPNVRFDTLPQITAQYANWQAVRIAPSKGLPHFEQIERVAAALDTFWVSAETSTSQPVSSSAP